MGGSAIPGMSAAPSHEQIEQLLARARRHPLGLDYLQRGQLESVAATFSVHAFLVDAAREHLNADAPSVEIVVEAASTVPWQRSAR